jgi:SAM-dependent methyltransferase
MANRKNGFMNEIKTVSLKCKICEIESDNEIILAQEKQLGLGDKFEYFICSKCFCLQIKEIPVNIDIYYPSRYYSYLEAKFPSKLNRVNFFLKKSLINYYMGYNDIPGFLLSFLFDHPFPWIRKKEIHFNSKILDVGTGAGRKILSMQRSGFSDLTGIDPFIEKDINYENGVKVLKRDISEIDGKYDLIMLHHSFEHMQNPRLVVDHISRLLSHEGCALIRIPVAGCFAWHKYRENWVGLDAPRHLFLHSPQSMNILLEKTDLKIDEIIFDSGAYQFTGSEKYSINLPLSTPNDIFSKKELRKFENDAKKLNANNQGDTACFYLKKNTK